MALDKALIDLVACPKCKGELNLADDESEFTCDACQLAYSVVDGIPNFLIEEARPLAQEK